MRFKVKKAFFDKEDGMKSYSENGIYVNDDEKRISELVRRGFIDDKNLDDSNETKADVKHVGGGYYELPNGEKVKGKDKALAALESGE